MTKLQSPFKQIPGMVYAYLKAQVPDSLSDAPADIGRDATEEIYCAYFRDNHGWATLGLLPPNVLCPCCGKRFGVPATATTTRCHGCDSVLAKLDDAWTTRREAHRQRHGPVTLGDAQPLNDQTTTRYVVN